MGNSPAFQFYASDWMASVSAMTLEERGAYITLLAWSWQHGPVPNDLKRQAMILGTHLGQTRRVLVEVLKRWTLNKNGKWINLRLEAVRADLEAFKERQAENGRKGGRPKKNQETQTKPKPFEWVSETGGFSKPTQNPNPNPEESSPISDLRSPRSLSRERLESDRAREPEPLSPVPPVWSRGGRPPLASGAAYHERNCPPWGAAACEAGFCIPKYLWPQWERRNGGTDAWTASLRMFVEQTVERTPPGAGDRVEDFWPAHFTRHYGTTVSTAKGKGDRSREAMQRAVERVTAAQLAKQEGVTRGSH